MGKIKGLLVRCPKCGRENYAPMVATNTCCWCGYNADEEDKENERKQAKKIKV